MLDLNPLTLQVGVVHFIGIGGIGMSGIAEILHNIGYKVQGSDQNNSANIERLQKLGIPITIGHAQENVGSAKYIVISSAIPDSNPELVAAKNNQLVILKRSEMLAELMRLKWSIAVAGTHGKTTTTSLVAAILQSDNKDPTVINGGIINSYKTNAYLGTSSWMVVEADESDGSFQFLPAMVAIVTNIDPEHLDYYGDYETLKESFSRFIHQIPFYGFAVVCYDHPTVREMLPKLYNRRVVTYGLSDGAEFQAKNIEYSEYGTKFEVTYIDKQTKKQQIIKDFWVPMLGEHNIQNALASLVVGYNLGIEWDSMKKGLTNFTGVKRRFTQVASIDGVKIIDDYGHHPVEIEAAIKAAKSATKGKVIVVVQPHRFSRLESLFDDFKSCLKNADTLYISDVYAAGETAENVTHQTLIDALKELGHNDVNYFQSIQKFAKEIKTQISSGDLILFLGAGNITKWAHQCPKELLLLHQNQ